MKARYERGWIQKTKPSLYVTMEEQKLGRFVSKTGCVYKKKLADIDTDVLRERILFSLQYVKSALFVEQVFYSKLI